LSDGATPGARLFVALQYLLPQRLLSRLIGRLARARAAWIRRPLIALFVRAYRPELADAEQPDPQRYASFNAFFTRALRRGARPMPAAAAAIASPADGRISALGTIGADRIFQAKGREYSLLALLGGNAGLAARFRDGLFMTIYLAPCNYHRVHMALPGTLAGAWHVPGRRFSVNDATAQQVEGLFARNERIVFAFEGGPGALQHDSAPAPVPVPAHALVMVGALFVGSISTVWHGDIAPPRGRGPTALPPPQPTSAGALARGAELGRFNMGSTVILLLPRALAAWDSGLAPGSALRVGQPIGRLVGA
jgi:phosphatidylserine decarboxylase